MIHVDELVCDEPGYMMVRTRVSDIGIGMSQDYLTKIFDAFTRERNTTKSKITGSGLRMSALLDDKEEMNEQKDRKTDKKKE